MRVYIIAYDIPAMFAEHRVVDFRPSSCPFLDQILASNQISSNTLAVKKKKTIINNNPIKYLRIQKEKSNLILNTIYQFLIVCMPTRTLMVEYKTKIS